MKTQLQFLVRLWTSIADMERYRFSKLKEQKLKHLQVVMIYLTNHKIEERNRNERETIYTIFVTFRGFYLIDHPESSLCFP